MERYLSFFASDVHLGLSVCDPIDREKRFVDFLHGIPKDKTEALYLLGDIWDFWYEYHDVVPMGYIPVFSAILDLIKSGVKVYFFKGNHDLWAYKYFETLGMIIVDHPMILDINGKKFCLAHGDGLGKGMYGYKLMKWVFTSRFFQIMYSCIHPWIAFRIARGWSKKSRLAKSLPYQFRNEEEPIYQWALEMSKKNHIDYFIFGHFHTLVDLKLPTGSEFHILKDWIGQSYFLYFDGISGILGSSPNMVK